MGLFWDQCEVKRIETALTAAVNAVEYEKPKDADVIEFIANHLLQNKSGEQASQQVST